MSRQEDFQEQAEKYANECGGTTQEKCAIMTEEVVKPDAPTALDGLSNVQKDNANKSTNYNGYDPTIIVRGSETTNKEE